MVQAQHQKEDGAEEKCGPHKIDIGPRRNPLIVKKDRDQTDQNDADGQVDVEDVTPGILADDPASQVRADDAADGKDAREQADGTFAVLGELLAHDARGRREEARPPDALKEPKDHQAIDVGRETAGKGTGRKKNEGCQVDLFPSVVIAQDSH